MNKQRILLVALGALLADPVVAFAAAQAPNMERLTLAENEKPVAEMKKTQTGENRPSFSSADRNGDQKLTKPEAQKAGLDGLVKVWKKADKDGNSTLSAAEYQAFVSSPQSVKKKPEPIARSFSTVDTNGDKKITKSEAREAGMDTLISKWKQADKNGNSTLDKSEFSAFTGEKTSKGLTVGQGKFKSPETVLWDEKADVYLVSNINGELTAKDGNGFISRVSPDGKIIDLKWIDGSKPEVVLNGPKGMIFDGDQLVVADVGAVRFFDRNTGKPIRAVIVKEAYMLNMLTVGPDGKTLYVTDTGGELKHPGAVYRLDEKKGPVAIAKGENLDRPDGIVAHEQALLITPFGAHAKEVYQLSIQGKRSKFATMPGAQLDGLLKLPDGSFLVTSWKGNSVYQLKNGKTTTIAKGIRTPAQIGYDGKRGRVIVPVLKEHKLLFYPLKVESRRKKKE